MSSLFQIDKLEESNYSTWSIQMKSILIQSDIWGVVCGRDVKPEDLASQYESQYETRNEKALASILLSVKSNQLKHIKSCVSASEAWRKLREVHQSKGPARKIMLFKKLLHISMQEGGSMNAHISEFSSLIDQLSEIEVTVPEEMLVILLLSSLPKPYESFVIAMESRDSLPILSILMVKLLEEDARQKEVTANHNNNNQRGGRAPQNRNNATFSRGGVSNNPKDNVRQPVAPREPPTGQHLFKTSLELKNDPLYLEAFCPSASEVLVPIAEEVNHFTGFEGLTPLVNESYENLCAHSLNFKRYISPSMYAYYVAVLSWARALFLKKKNRYRLTHDELEFIEMIYTERNYILPKSLVIYLSGFGNFTIPSSVESKFNTKPYEYDAAGFFRDMENEFYLTASYPNITLFAERVSYDLAYTEDPDIGPVWQPNKIDRNWNTRCIGYADAMRLSEMQRQVILLAGIPSEGFPADVNNFKVCIRLLNSVNKYLLEIPTLESGPIPTNVMGSQGQLILDRVDERVANLLSIDGIGSASFISKSPFHVPGSTSYLGGTFMYRVDKNLPRATAKLFFPFDIDPTAAQIDVLNSLNTDWSPLLMDITHLANVPFNPDLRLKKFMSIDIKLTST